MKALLRGVVEGEVESWRTRAAFYYLHRAVVRGNQSELVSY